MFDTWQVVKNTTLADCVHVTSQKWRHRRKNCSMYASSVNVQNVCFGLFIFSKVTEIYRFVTYLWDDPHIRRICSDNYSAWVCRKCANYVKLWLPKPTLVYQLAYIRILMQWCHILHLVCYSQHVCSAYAMSVHVRGFEFNVNRAQFILER